MTQPTNEPESDRASTKGQKLKSKKLTAGNDAVTKGGRAMTGSRIDQIEVNPVMKEATGEHTAVTNLNMRAQPVHVGHAKIVKAVEDEAKRVGGSAHIVTSHSEGDDKNPIPAKKKVQYLKKIASPGTLVTQTSKAEPSIFHTAARLNRHAHHLVVVAGSDRAKEYENLLNKYNGKPGPHGHYNFKSITVKSIGRDPDAEGTAGVSGTKMREHAKNGNISAFKKGLPRELHGHAEEMMNDINKSSKKSFKESVNQFFEEIMNSAGSGAIRGLGNVTGNVSGDEDTMNTYALKNSVEADTKDNIMKLAVKGHADLHKAKTEETLHMIETVFEAIDRQDTSKREWGTTSLTKTYKGDTPGEKFGKNREAIPRSGQDPKNKDLVTRSGDRTKEDKAYRTQAIKKNAIDEKFAEKLNELDALNATVGKANTYSMSSSSTTTPKMPNVKDSWPFKKDPKMPNTKDFNPPMFNKEAYGKGYKSPADKIADAAKRMGRKDPLQGMSDAAEKLKQNAADYQKIIDKDKKNEEVERVEEERKGLWANIWARRRAGKRMRKPGEKGAPTAAALKAAQESVEIDEASSAGLADKAKKSGVSLSTLQKVYRRGVAAWNSGHRPGTTPQQWGMARVNSYIAKGKGTYGGADKDLHEDHEEVEENYSADKKEYHAGLSKSTAKARVAHWKKMSKYSDRDPRAYQPAPGDATAKTKPSKYTIAYHKKYGD